MKAEAIRWSVSPRDEAQGSDDGRLYAAHAAADLLGIHRSTLYLAVRNKKLTPDAYTLGGHARFSISTLRQFSERLAHGSATGGESSATRAIASAVASLSRFATLKPVCEVIIDAVLEVCPSLEGGMVLSYAHDSQRDVPGLVVSKGVSRRIETEYRWVRQRPGASLITTLTDHKGARLVINDTHGECLGVPEASLQILRSTGYRSCVFLPCDYDGLTLGYLIGVGRKPCTFTEHELGALGVLTDIVTIALRRIRRENAIQEQIKATEELLKRATLLSDAGSTAQHVAKLRSVFQQATHAVHVCESGLGEAPAAESPPRLTDLMHLAASKNAPQRTTWTSESGHFIGIATPAKSTHAQAAVGACWRQVDLRSGMELAFLQVYAQACEMVTRA